MRSILFWIGFHREKKTGLLKSVYRGIKTFKELHRIEKSLTKLVRR